MMGMRSDPAVSVRKAASQLMKLLKEENKQLGLGKPERVEALLADKARLSTELDQALLHFKEQGCDKMAITPVIRDLTHIIAENQNLLEHVSAVQTEFLKFICAPSVEEVTQSYSPSGHYVASSSERSAMTLRSEV